MIPNKGLTPSCFTVLIPQLIPAPLNPNPIYRDPNKRRLQLNPNKRLKLNFNPNKTLGYKISKRF